MEIKRDESYYKTIELIEEGVKDPIKIAITVRKPLSWVRRVGLEYLSQKLGISPDELLSLFEFLEEAKEAGIQPEPEDILKYLKATKELLKGEIELKKEEIRKLREEIEFLREALRKLGQKS